MKKQIIFFGILASFIVSTLVGASGWASPLPVFRHGPDLDSHWEKMSDDDGVVVHRREVENSDIIAFRGEGFVNASISKVAAVLIDTTRKKEWMPRLEEAKRIRQVNEDERIEYNHTASGFFAVRDRDFVVRAKAVLEKDKNRLRFMFYSIEDPAMPETDKVRGVIDEGEFTLTKAGPEKTHLVLYVHADPKGAVPKWLVNLFQKSWPRKAMEGIRAQVAKPDVFEDERIKALFQ